MSLFNNEDMFIIIHVVRLMHLVYIHVYNYIFKNQGMRISIQTLK